MKNTFTVLFMIISPLYLSSQVLWDDFEQNRIGYYEFVHGGMTTRYANPDPSSSVNSSATCAQYVRNPGELYDVLVIVGNGALDDVSAYVDGSKTMSVDVFSPAAGIPVQITLEDSSLAGPTNYPVGRHSIYLGTTTVANQWETISLAFDSRPDASIPDAGLTSVILLFNAGTNTDDIYYFDNLYGPELNNQCDGVTINPNQNLANWDCSWNLGMCPSASACVAYDYMSGWLNQVYNPETNTINSSKYCGEYTRNPDANGEDVFIAYPLNGSFDIGSTPYFNMKVYGPPTSLYVSFQNNGTEVVGFNQGIWQNNTWQQINFDLTPFQSGGMSLDRVVFFFDQGLVNWDTYYIDDIGLSAAPVSVSEISKEPFKFWIYSSPLNDESVIKFTLEENSSVKLEALDLQGKNVSTFIDNDLSPGDYSIKIGSDLANGVYLIKALVNGSIITKKASIHK